MELLSIFREHVSIARPSVDNAFIDLEDFVIIGFRCVRQRGSACRQPQGVCRQQGSSCDPCRESQKDFPSIPKPVKDWDIGPTRMT